MVFYDLHGRRKQYVWGTALLILIVSAIFATLVFTALTPLADAEAPAYVNAEEDPRFQKTIALTFDDGPHPRYTRELMTLLKQEDVPATFFLIGQNVVKHGDVAREIVENGFEIGNHTFTHSEHMADSENRLRNELVSTDRVIRDATGRHPILFRPPFLEDIDVGEFDGSRFDSTEVRWAENNGYIVVGGNLDTQDWNVVSGDAGTILARLRERLPEDGNPLVIIMHEHAGEGATIDALRTFIPEMKQQGYRFVFVSEYFGLTREQTMPVSAPAGFLDKVLVSAAKAFVASMSSFNLLILVVSIIGLARLWTILALRRGFVPFRAGTALAEKRGPVSVLIPAYNEAANIEATLRSVFAGIRVRDEAIVIDDGSTDETAAIVRGLQDEFGPRLRLYKKENGGTKGAALMFGLAFARHDVILSIDADTVIDGGAIDTLARHFDDPSVGAVAGKVYPARVDSALGAFQYLEYMQGQNLEKEVFAMGNAIGVVPGAIGAWRMSALRDVGGYSLDTVVEDQDLTLALISRGWRVRFERDARAYTETPDTMKSFFRQRCRWVYGTMQCVWKYRSWLFSRKQPSLGFIILPNVILFNLFVPLLVPVLDAAVLFGLAGVVNIWPVLVPFLIYTLFDMWCAIEGISYERTPPYRLIPLVLWQRFFYRYMMAAAIIQGFGTALAGTFVGWGLQKRRGECHPALQELIATSRLTPSPIRVEIGAPVTSGS